MNTETNISKPTRLLVAEDELEIRDYLHSALNRPNFIIDFAQDGEEVLSAFAKNKPALLILDVLMPRKDGIATLKEIRRQDPSLPIIMLSGLSSAMHRLEAMKNGANSYLTKPVLHAELRNVVDSFLPAAPFVARAADPFTRKPELNLTAANWLRKIEPLLNRMADSDVPLLLQGETGVGKEVLARQIHNQSLRAGNIFLKLNCAALPAELVESELFGYERGAFTGAMKSNPGKFELANGGTILLDEIGDMDLRLQAKLLQVLQDREFLRLGAKEPTQVDVRVIAATHRRLEERIAEGEFREDLYYRLNVVNIVIPPLRERADEIMPLASFFLKKHSLPQHIVPEITPDLRAALLLYRWPGNIRELENVMRRYLLVRNPQVIAEELNSRATRTSHLISSADERDIPSARCSTSSVAPSDPVTPATIGQSASSAPPSGARYVPDSSEGADLQLAKLDLARRDAEADVIRKTLYSTQWNRKRAAALLGIDYKALLYRMKKLGID